MIPPAMHETWVRSLGWEDPLEKGKATHSSILTWRIADCVVHAVAKSWTQLSDFHFTSVLILFGVQLSCGFYFKVQWNAEMNPLQYLSVSKRFPTTCIETRYIKFC